MSSKITNSNILASTDFPQVTKFVLRTKDVRCRICNQLQQERQTSTYLEKKWWNKIFTWININSVDDGNIDIDTLQLPIIGIISQNTINNWTQLLTNSGYTVTSDTQFLTIS